MKRKRFSVVTITRILKQTDLGTPIADLYRTHGVSEQGYYRWNKIYGGMEPSEARQLKLLREENIKLKRLVADLSLDKAENGAATAGHQPLAIGQQRRELTHTHWQVFSRGASSLEDVVLTGLMERAYWRGEQPMIRRKAALNALLDS